MTTLLSDALKADFRHDWQAALDRLSACAIGASIDDNRVRSAILLRIMAERLSECETAWAPLAGPPPELPPAMAAFRHAALLFAQQERRDADSPAALQLWEAAMQYASSLAGASPRQG